MNRAHPTIGTSRARAMTFVELIMAVGATVFVGTAVAAMLFATNYGFSSRADIRASVVKAKTTTARMGATIRSARMVLDQGDDFLVLWLADTNEDDAPSLSEVQRLERDGAANVLRSYVAPDTLAAADDTLFDLATTDFDAETDAVKGTAVFPRELWATDVSEWLLSLDALDARSARLISYRVTFDLGNLAETFAGASALRYPTESP